jgi:hypothetical protein
MLSTQVLSPRRVKKVQIREELLMNQCSKSGTRLRDSPKQGSLEVRARFRLRSTLLQRRKSQILKIKRILHHLRSSMMPAIRNEWLERAIWTWQLLRTNRSLSSQITVKESRTKLKMRRVKMILSISRLWSKNTGKSVFATKLISSLRYSLKT